MGWLAWRAADRHNRVVIRCRDPRRSETPPVGRAHRAALVALVAFLLAAPPVRGDDAADGRRHAQRASHLAAAGKCRQAIAEFDKAIAVLHDPTLLFNRGECHRKLGDADSALEDYHQFLSDLPNAPNRAQVEARIGELRDGKNKGKERKGRTESSSRALQDAG